VGDPHYEHQTRPRPTVDMQSAIPMPKSQPSVIDTADLLDKGSLQVSAQLSQVRVTMRASQSGDKYSFPYEYTYIFMDKFVTL